MMSGGRSGRPWHAGGGDNDPAFYGRAAQESEQRQYAARVGCGDVLRVGFVDLCCFIRPRIIRLGADTELVGCPPEGMSSAASR
jgi:hypothetical protein